MHRQPSVAVPDETSTPLRMSEEIAALLAALPQHRVTLREVLATFKGRAYTLLLLILALPFCQPLPLPGLSTLFGTIIALVGLRLSLKLEPRIPAAMLEKPIPTRLLVVTLTATMRIVRMLEIVLRPRWSFLVEWTLLHRLHGAMICVSGLFLLLPLPVPLSNVLPAFAIFLLAAAMLERDGLVGLLGFIVFGITVVVFGGIFLAGVAALEVVWEWILRFPRSG